MIFRSRTLRPLWVTTLLYGGLFAFGLMLSGVAIYYEAMRSLIGDLDARLTTESRAILSGRPDTSLGEIQRRIAERQWHARDDDLAYLLLSADGRVISGNVRLRFPPVGFANVDFVEASGKPDHGRALGVRRADGSLLVLVADNDPVEELHAKLLWIGAISLTVTAIIGAIAGLAMTASISRRIEVTTRTARSIMAGDLKQRMPFDGSGGPFDRQAIVFNQMLDRIEALMDQLRQISADVAHDLRTPLAVLRNKLLAMCEAGEQVQIEPRELESAVSQSESLLALFAAILRISEVESGSRREGFARVDLSTLASELAATFAPIAEDQAQTIVLGASEAVSVEGDRELIAQAVINLLENALKYTGPGTTIVLTVISKPGCAVIAVRDDGPGIAPLDRDTALRRFGRLDGSRSKPGHGLGLSLVSSIAKAHGGGLSLGDAGPGLIAELQLPRPQQAD
ncbi:sensor histidine kinase [Sphingomonas nostoxanthinifaciens]|uniref:sensor histidine kinase n=1 Tax=Sphingomonas nostoxanthinifaciens TaxID=2872652 RepID=UPI001CC217C0|nr:HAMP domain-containing sensor histidine kinase [Sphingomonas nostoxanthinifaciens]UAK25800.1 HAMP domain-containing histidine kinase [Sphingomonas nostoxanthinifaciens]